VPLLDATRTLGTLEFAEIRKVWYPGGALLLTLPHFAPTGRWAGLYMLDRIFPVDVQGGVDRLPI
jgi:hypothetical protein